MQSFGGSWGMRKQQSGFTLIELAIVLVIIGLLLGGVLKGQELINSAKAKNIIADFKSVQIFIYGYQDKFRTLPGDDNNPTGHLGVQTTTLGAGNGNGVIEGAWNSFASPAALESEVFWQHVRLSGLAAGPTVLGAANYYPTNAEGGRLGVQSLNTTFTTITDMNGSYVVCSERIPGKIVRQIDVNLDDGETNTGSVRAVVAGTAGVAIASSAIVDGSPYTVCMSF
jgi:prepilin-type N-terminal cleavage/methylation domain-containing protein